MKKRYTKPKRQKRISRRKFEHLDECNEQLIWWAAQNGIICIKQGHDFIFQKQPLPPSSAQPTAVSSAESYTPPCSPETIPVAASPVCSPSASPPVSSSSPSPDASLADTRDDTPARPLDF